MNSDEIKSNCIEVDDKIKLTWGKLREDGLSTITGQRNQLIGLLQERYGYEKEDAENWVIHFMQELS